MSLSSSSHSVSFYQSTTLQLHTLVHNLSHSRIHPPPSPFSQCRSDILHTHTTFQDKQRKMTQRASTKLARTTTSLPLAPKNSNGKAKEEEEKKKKKGGGGRQNEPNQNSHEALVSHRKAIIVNRFSHIICNAHNPPATAAHMNSYVYIFGQNRNLKPQTPETRNQNQSQHARTEHYSPPAAFHPHSRRVSTQAAPEAP